MNMFGWTTYGWTHWGNPSWNEGPEETEARVYKHHTGLVVAIPADTEDPFLVLSQMNRYLEDTVTTARDVSGNYPDKERAGPGQMLQYIAKRWGPQQCQHQWAIIGVDYPDAPALHPRMQASQMTNVTLKCHCGMLHGLTLNGHWTMEQLMMKVGEQIASQARSTPGPEQSDNQPSGEYPPAG